MQQLVDGVPLTDAPAAESSPGASQTAAIVADDAGRGVSSEDMDAAGQSVMQP
jgi:hypothetical protein